jgi:hypothetical protein
MGTMSYTLHPPKGRSKEMVDLEALKGYPCDVEKQITSNDYDILEIRTPDAIIHIRPRRVGRPTTIQVYAANGIPQSIQVDNSDPRFLAVEIFNDVRQTGIGKNPVTTSQKELLDKLNGKVEAPKLSKE